MRNKQEDEQDGLGVDAQNTGDEIESLERQNKRFRRLGKELEKVKKDQDEALKRLTVKFD